MAESRWKLTSAPAWVAFMVLFTALLSWGLRLAISYSGSGSRSEESVKLAKKQSFSFKYSTPTFREDEAKQITCLAKNIYFEARSDGLVGWLAVAEVTMNRVKANFGDDVCSVVYSAVLGANRKPVTGKCAFSWYCDDLPDEVSEKAVYERIHELATEVYLGGKYSEIDITGGATHYHNHTVVPYWAKKMRQTAVINGHVFYRET